MDGRAFRRISVDKEISCQIGDRSEWVVLYDLSAGGAMLEVGSIGLQMGEPIILNLHDIISVTGQIAWKIDGNAGVKFDGILSHVILEHLGFSSSTLHFEEQQPRGRLGEILAIPALGSSVSQLEETPETGTWPADLLSGASLQIDRRMNDRGDADHRKEERLALSANAKLCLSLREGVEGRLLDLSTAGCSFLDTTASFQSGDQVWLKMEGLENWRGTVRWVHGPKVGIKFERPFYPAVLNHLVEKHRGVFVSRAA